LQREKQQLRHIVSEQYRREHVNIEGLRSESRLDPTGYHMPIGPSDEFQQAFKELQD